MNPRQENAVGPSDPPPIPMVQVPPTAHPGHTVIWVRTGVVRVRFEDGTESRIGPGEGIWLPAGQRKGVSTVTDPGTVAFPYWPHAGVGSLTEPSRFEVPHEWQDWLIQYFNLQVTPLSGRGYSPDGIASILLTGSRPPAQSRQEDTDETALLAPPALPTAVGARAVAEALIHDPALDLTVHEWAIRVSSSARTLLRDFLTDTGLTFEQWRRRHRMITSTRLLSAGHEIDQVMARVGFTSRGGFVYAFKQQFGVTPHRFVQELAVRTAATGRTAELVRADALVRLARGSEDPSGAPALLPAARTPAHTNNGHVLSWMYRGSGYLDITGRRWERRRGVATWIPAGAEHVTGLRKNSISLPLGEVGTTDLQLAAPIQAQFSPAWDDYLMFCAVSARSVMRPENYDPRHILDLFTEQVASQRALSVPMPTDPRAREAAMDYLRRIGTLAEPGAFDLPDEVQRAFPAQTGMSFARWRYAARMRIARDLLAGGTKPSAVARRVGYRHLPNFSAAFSRFHGVSPREYQDREAERT